MTEKKEDIKIEIEGEEVEVEETANVDTNADDKIEISTRACSADEPKKEEQEKPKVATKTVDNKRVVELTDAEKEIIVANAKAGYDQPNFEVKLYKNGGYRIIKKKEKPKSVSEKVIESIKEEKTNPTSTTKKAYYTNDQLLMEHVIDLNAKFERLMTKHKKLKKRYLNMRDDIYVDVEDNDGEVEKVVNEKVEEPKITPQTPEIPEKIVTEQRIQVPISRGWRSSISYL